MWVISPKELIKIEDAIKKGKSKVVVALNLGLNIKEISTKGILVPKKIKDNVCYLFNTKIRPIIFYSSKTKKVYKLVPTKDWPTITISSTQMHRTKNTSPKLDSLSKIKAVKPKGIILDTCTGLGYTAILCSKYADLVYTFEKDINVLRIAKLNPYSAALFQKKNIKLINKDISKEIKKFKDRFFNRIIHDPPTFKYAPELYTESFYKELVRVLKYRGILYHYCPRPHVTKERRPFYSKIKEKLKKLGLEVRFVSHSQGLICKKFF